MRLSAALAVGVCAMQAAVAQVPLTAERAIEWTDFGPAGEQTITFSGDRRYAAVVLETPDIAANVVRSRLILVDPVTGALREIAMFASNSNEPAIRSVQWSGDDQLVWFIGEQPGSDAQLFHFDVVRGELHQDTHARSDVLAYGAGNSKVIYAARRKLSEDWFAASAPTGYAVQGWETFAELQNPRNADLDWLADYTLFVMDRADGSTKQIDVQTVRQDPRSLKFRMSPDESSVVADLRTPGMPRHGFATEPVVIELGDRSVKHDKPRSVGNAIKLTIEEDNDTPPRLIASSRSGKRRVLLDPNGGAFSQLPRWQQVEWQSQDGRTWRAGLLLPASGKPPFPLVIQTHGYDRKKFLVSGPFTTAFAAQPLVSLGYAVLQLPDDGKSIASADPMLAEQEAAIHLAAYESGIEYLAQRGLADPGKVGLIGFSRTCYHVKYALAFSRYAIKAVVASDGVDMGYGTYLAWAQGMDPRWPQQIEQRNGGSPFGSAMRLWAERLPQFNLGRVRGALRTETLSEHNIGMGWEMHAGLRRLGLPSDYVIYSGGAHELFKPAQRRASMQGTIDWMQFWLQEYEDPSPTKAEQYSRWRRLR